MSHDVQSASAPVDEAAVAEMIVALGKVLHARAIMLFEREKYRSAQDVLDKTIAEFNKIANQPTSLVSSPDQPVTMLYGPQPPGCTMQERR